MLKLSMGILRKFIKSSKNFKKNILEISQVKSTKLKIVVIKYGVTLTYFHTILNLVWKTFLELSLEL